MDEARIQQRIADTLLERGVRFKIPAPFFLKLIGKKHEELVIYPLKYGTLIAMSRLSAQLGADIEKLEGGSINEAMVLVNKHGDLVAKWIAIAVLGEKWKIERYTDKLAKKLTWRLTPSRLGELFLLVAMLSGVQDFTNIIRFLNTTNLTKRTNDGIGENLSQKESGS